MIIKDKIYGNQKIDDQLIIDIIKTPEMQRLKGINQYSTYQFISKINNTSRFEHCLGVYFLLKKFNAPFEEQIAGLIHDISHTVFSHVSDYLYDDIENQEHHHNHHNRIIQNSKIPLLLKNNNIDINYILNENNFPLLEKPIPALCADRLDYFMRDTFTIKTSTLSDVKKYLNAIIIHNNEFILNNLDIAREITNKFLETTLNFYATHFQAGSFELLANAFKIALKNRIITEDDLFTTDLEITNKLKQSKNKQILENLSLIELDKLVQGTKQDNDFFTKSKARFIDPKVLNNNKVSRLSELDNNFKQKIEHLKKKVQEGYYIKIKRG